MLAGPSRKSLLEEASTCKGPVADMMRMARPLLVLGALTVAARHENQSPPALGLAAFIPPLAGSPVKMRPTACDSALSRPAGCHRCFPGPAVGRVQSALGSGVRSWAQQPAAHRGEFLVLFAQKGAGGAGNPPDQGSAPRQGSATGRRRQGSRKRRGDTARGGRAAGGRQRPATHAGQLERGLDEGEEGLLPDEVLVQRNASAKANDDGGGDSMTLTQVDSVGRVERNGRGAKGQAAADETAGVTAGPGDRGVVGDWLAKLGGRTWGVVGQLGELGPLGRGAEEWEEMYDGDSMFFDGGSGGNEGWKTMSGGYSEGDSILEEEDRFVQPVMPAAFEGRELEMQEVETYWMDYQMQVPCEEPRRGGSGVLEALATLEQQQADGEIDAEAFAAAKAAMRAQFFGAVVDESRAVRAFASKDVGVVVTNSALFVNAWLRANVVDAGLATVGVSVEWNSGARVKGGQRHRISILQIATPEAVLVVQLALLRPASLPELLRDVLEDVNVRKVGNAILTDAVKLAKDWGVQLRGRVDAYKRAGEFGYIDASRKNNKGVAALARKVLICVSRALVSCVCLMPSWLWLAR